jgi:hypothetical protein
MWSERGRGEVAQIACDDHARLGLHCRRDHVSVFRIIRHLVDVRPEFGDRRLWKDLTQHADESLGLILWPPKLADQVAPNLIQYLVRPEHLVQASASRSQ